MPYWCFYHQVYYQCKCAIEKDEPLHTSCTVLMLPSFNAVWSSHFASLAYLPTILHNLLKAAKAIQYRNTALYILYEQCCTYLIQMKQEIYINCPADRTLLSTKSMQIILCIVALLDMSSLLLQDRKLGIYLFIYVLGFY